MITLQGIHKLRWLLAFCIALGVALLWQPLPARAETITVTNTLDAGAGSLRAAIAAAAPGDTVVFSDTLAGQTILLSSQLVIDKPLTLDGAALAAPIHISGGGITRTFYITADATLSHLNIINGLAPDGGGVYNTAALTLTHCIVSNNTADQGGGLYNTGTLFVENSTLSGNWTDPDGLSGLGGGLYNQGTATIQNSTVSGNITSNSYNTGKGGGIFNASGAWLTVRSSNVSSNSANHSGGIYNAGTLTVESSTLSGNNAFGTGDGRGDGGGIRNTGTLTVQNSTLSGNSAGFGGGIYNGWALTVQNSTFFGNTAGNWGGGIDNFYGTLTVQNSTFSGNTAGDWGGGICNYDGNVAITYSTLTGNSARFGGGLHATNYGGYVRVGSSLITGNSGDGDVAAGMGDDYPEVMIRFESLGYNIIGVAGRLVDFTEEFTASHDLTDVTLTLDPLADNGGPTLTRALPPDSPAIDAGDPLTCPAADQRGATRPQGADCDIGAFEAGPPEMTVLGNSTVITNGAASPSFANHTDFGSAEVSGGQITRTFTISNSGGEILTLTGSPRVTITGPAAGDFSVTTQPDTPVGLNLTTTFTVRFAPTVIGTRAATVTITNNDPDENPYAFAIQGTGLCANVITVTNTADSGAGSLRQAIAGVCVGGEVNFAPALAGETITLTEVITIGKPLTLDGSGLSARVRLSGDDATRVFVIEDTAAVTMTQLILTQGYANYHPECIYYGGAICNTGTLTLQDMHFTDNSAQEGGAVYSYANTRLWVNASEFYSNTATGDGGALYVYYDNTSAQVMGSVFMTNTAYNGGAIVNQGAMLTITDSLVSGNRSTQSGGGLFLYDGTTTLAGNTIVHNQAMSGGGVYNFAGTVAITGTHLLTNTGTTGGALYNSEGHLSITQTLIAGNIAADSGGGLFLYGGAVAISDSTLRANRTHPGSGRWGGAILNTEWSVLVITRSAFTGNQARTDGGGICNLSASLTVQASDFISNTAITGGALYSGNGTLNVTASAFYSNTATIKGGGLCIGGGDAAIATSIVTSNTAASGAGLYSEYSTVSLTNSTLSGNTANTGGALYSGNGTLNVTAGAFYSNTATTNGGGLRIVGGDATITTSTVASNTAANGAGIYNEGAYVNLTNSTLSGNTATLSGGGLVNNPGNLTLHHVTLAANSAITGGGLINMGGVLDAYNNILAHNVGGDCDNTTTLGFIAANVHNLIADGSCNENAIGLITGDPRLTPLDAAGVHALQPDSPAIDAGDAATCLATDQRGVTRPQGAACDIGAYEATTPHIRINKTVTPPVIVPGQAITFTLTLSNDGSIPVTGIVVTDTLPSLLENVSFASTLIITDTGHTPSYVWMVQTLAPGQSGVITISGVLTVPLTAGVYSNTATIAIAGNLLATGNTAVVTFTVPNVTPAFISMPITVTPQDALYTYTVIAGDDNGDVLTLTAPTLPTWLTFSAHGDGTATLTGTPANSDVGAHAVALRVTDSSGLFATQVFTLTVTNVNDAPEFTSAPITTATQDTLYTYAVTAADLDVGDTLVITATTKPAWLILTDHGDGTATLTGTPTNSDVSDHPVVLRVTDSGGLFATQVFTITVANVNDAPFFTSAPITTATQDTLYTYAVTAADLDVGDTLVITATTKPAWLMLTDHGDGTATLTGTPTDADVGAHPVVLRVTDSAGLFVEQVFTITVTEKPKYYLYLPLALKNAP